MFNVLLVALGGAVGAVARYGVGLGAARWFGLAFPWGTLIVNILGGLAMGLLTARFGPEQEAVRLPLAWVCWAASPRFRRFRWRRCGSWSINPASPCSTSPLRCS
jgi:hypothetical protein